MRRNWIALVLALSMMATMTGCGGNNGNDTGTSGGGNSSVSGSAGQNASGSVPSQDVGGGGTDSSGSGTAPGSMSQKNGTGDWNGVTGRAGYDRKTGTAQRRTAYDYLHDGRYRADGSGDVDGNMNNGTRDLTQGARDMIRGAGNAIGDAGNAVTGAVGKMGRDLRNMTRSNMDE